MAKTKKQIRALYRKKFAKQKSNIADIELQITPEEQETLRQIKSRKAKKVYIKKIKTTKLKTISIPKIKNDGVKQDIAPQIRNILNRTNRQTKTLNTLLKKHLGMSDKQIIEFFKDIDMDTFMDIYNDEMSKHAHAVLYGEDEDLEIFRETKVKRDFDKETFKRNLHNMVLDAKTLARKNEV